MITESLPQTQQEKLPFEVYLQNQLAEMRNALDEKNKVIEKEIRKNEFFKALLDENNIPYSLD